MIRGNKWRREWRIVMPLYDGRECPECGACCIGKESQRFHWDWHNKQREFRGNVNRNFETIAHALDIEPEYENQTDTEDDDSDDEKEPTGYVL